MVNILALSELFPYPAQPGHGIFTQHRLSALSQASAVKEIRVVCPIPSFPTRSINVGPYHLLNKVPAEAKLAGLQVCYPHYVNIPKLGMRAQPRLMARALKPVLESMIRDGFDFDVIDAYCKFATARQHAFENLQNAH